MTEQIIIGEKNCKETLTAKNTAEISVAVINDLPDGVIAFNSKTEKLFKNMLSKIGQMEVKGHIEK